MPWPGVPDDVVATLVDSAGASKLKVFASMSTVVPSMSTVVPSIETVFQTILEVVPSRLNLTHVPDNSSV